MPVMNGSRIKTDSEMTRKARYACHALRGKRCVLKVRLQLQLLLRSPERFLILTDVNE